MAKRCTGSCTAVRIWTTIEHAKSTARSSMRRNEVREGHRCSSHAHAKLHARPLNGRCLLSTSERKNQTACPTSSQGIRASRIWVHEAALNKAHGCGDALPCCCTACPQPANCRHWDWAENELSSRRPREVCFGRLSQLFNSFLESQGGWDVHSC